MLRRDAERLRDELVEIKRAGGTTFVVVREREHPSRRDRVEWGASVDEVLEALEVFINAEWNT